MAVELDETFCGDLEEFDCEGTVLAATVGGLSVDVSRGRCVVVKLNNGPHVERAVNGRFSGSLRDVHVTCREAVDSSFDNVALSLEPDGLLSGCSGHIRVIAAERARILSDVTRPLSLGARSDDETRIGDAPRLKASTLVGVYLSAASIGKLIAAMPEVAQLDLAPTAFQDLVGTLPPTIRLQTLERLHEITLAKAQQPQTVDAAGAAVLEARRKRADHASLDYLLLSVARLFRYGQSIARPLIAWAVLTVVIFAHRVVRAFQDDRGFVRSSPHLHVTLDWRLWHSAGDSFLSAALLPANWVRLQEAAPAIGLSGGYLSAARLVLLFFVVLFVAAARRRLRVSRRG